MVRISSGLHLSRLLNNLVSGIRGFDLGTLINQDALVVTDCAYHAFSQCIHIHSTPFLGHITVYIALFGSDNGVNGSVRAFWNDT